MPLESLAEPFSPANESSLRYPGWSVAAAAFSGVMVSFAPIVPYTFSLFLAPLHAAFGWRREAMGGAFALAAIAVALLSPAIGLLLDRFPPRRIILPAFVIFALALASLNRLGPDLRRFYLNFFVLGVVANGTAQFTYARTILPGFSAAEASPWLWSSRAAAWVPSSSRLSRSGRLPTTGGVTPTCSSAPWRCLGSRSRRCWCATAPPKSVDGLATWQPRNPAMYVEMGKMMAEHGYVRTAAAPPSAAG